MAGQKKKHSAQVNLPNSLTQCLLWASGLLLGIVIGCREAPQPKSTNNENRIAAKTNGTQLTAKQAAEIMAWEIGKWTITGQGRPEGGEPQPVKMAKLVRWKEKGKSLEYQFNLLENGQPVTYYGHQEFDAVKGLFICRFKWGDNPETTSHDRFDPATRTTYSQTVPTTPPSDTKTVTVSRRIGEDQIHQEMEVFDQERQVYFQELVSTRIDGHLPETSPKRKTKSR
jgi:hypothetical protein